MKKQITSLFIACLPLLIFCFGCGKDDANPKLPTDGLMLYLPFDDGSTKNESSTPPPGSDAFPAGGEPTEDRFGKSQNAWHFDGVDDYLEVQHHDAFNFGSQQKFSISLWVRAEQAQKDKGTNVNDILAKWVNNEGSTDGKGYPFCIRIMNETHEDTGVTFEEGEIYAGRWEGSASSCNHFPRARSGVSLNDGEYHHLVFMKSGIELTLYVDGEQAGSTIDETVCDTRNTAPLRIGKRKGNHFTGDIDDLRIYNRALDDDEIEALFEEK